MPEQHINFTEADFAILERVRVQQGLETIEQTVEWLAKNRLRQNSKLLTGRGRALYLVERNQQ